MFEVVCDNF